MLGMSLFSLTPPATRAAVMHLQPEVVVSLRILIAALIAALILWLRGKGIPPRRLWRRLLVVSVCVVIAFPLLITLALETASAAATGIVLGILPLASLAYAVRGAEYRPPLLFWCCCAAAGLSVIVFTLSKDSSALTWSDGLLFVAVLFAAIGYVEGGRLSAGLGGWQVICWALVIAIPVMLPVLLYILPAAQVSAPVSAWVGVLYLALASQLFGFFAWYHGLALGGAMRVSQVLFLMPFVTLGFSSLLLGERAGPAAWGFAALTVSLVGAGWYSFHASGRPA